MGSHLCFLRGDTGRKDWTVAKPCCRIYLTKIHTLLALAIVLVAFPAAGDAAPNRVVSVNMCTDELLLLLARPEQIASVTHLAQDPDEFPFWRSGRRFPANDGSVMSVVGYRPDLILTMGGVARDRARIAERIGADIVAFAG